MYNRRSIGVILVRITESNTLEYLVVKKRLSYEFVDFVMDHYDRSMLPKMLNSMTVDERLEIATLDFARMWHRIYLEVNAQDPYYLKKKARFESHYINDDGGVRLLDRINRSEYNGNDGIWEFPKGRREHHETDINCAIREVYEETGIIKDAYRIIPRQLRIQSFTDNNVCYNNIYYIGVITSKYSDARLRMSNREQIKEISAIRWMTVNELRMVDAHDRLVSMIKGINKLLK